MSVYTFARRPPRETAVTAARGIAVGLAVCVVGAILGWLVMGQAGLYAAGGCLLVILLVAAAALFGFDGFIISLLVLAMLPLPTVAVGTAQFPFATVAIPIVLVGAVLAARRRGIPAQIPHLVPYLALLGVGAISLAASYLFWDLRVGTSAERGFGHRSIDYQLAGLYFLAVPILAMAGGVVASRLARLERVYAWVFAATLGLSLLLLAAWLPHPINPIDAFAQKARPTADNHWAAYLVVMAVALLVYARRVALRLFAVVALLVGLAGTAVAYVLSSWLGVLAAVTLIIWHRFRARGLILWFGALTVGGLILASPITTIVAQRAASRDTDRLGLWLSALTVWTRSPVIGVGPGNFASYMEAYSIFPVGSVLRGYQQAHNIFLEILAENGIIGMILFALFIGLVVRTLMRARFGTPLQSFGITVGLGVLVTSAVTVFFGGGLFVPTIASAGYNQLPIAFVAWFLIGCGVGLARSASMRATTVVTRASRREASRQKDER